MSEFSSTIRRRPQLGLEELNQLRWLLGGLLTLLSAWTIFYLEIDAWALMGLTTVATVACLVWPRLPGLVPTFAHTFAFPLVVAFFLGDLWLKGDALPAIVRLDLLLLFYRAISYRRRRDDLQIIVLGLFLIVVAGVLTVSLAFAVQLLAFAGCALALLLVLTLVQAMEDDNAKQGASDPEKTFPSWAAHVKWRRLFKRVLQATDWRVVVLGGILFVGVVVLSAILFVAIPRFQLENSLFLERFVVHKARTGFSDSIKFGDVTEIQQDTSVALSVDVSERSQMPESPYWRMLVLDQYANGTFKLSAELRGTLDKLTTDAVITGKVTTGVSRRREPVQWVFYLESGVRSRYLPLLGTFGELRFRELQSYQYSGQLGVVALRDEPATMTAYRVEDFAPAGSLQDPRFAERWRGREIPSLTPLPPALQVGLEGVAGQDRRDLVQLAAEISGMPLPENHRGQPAENLIERATLWLRRNHGYSLSPRIPGGPGDPLVLWMRSREPGHCELFAGSLVLLARASGFPARVVTGFRGGSWNGYSNNLTVRNSDAHAWAEIFDETSGAWLRADALATPVAAVENTAAKKTAAQMRRVDRGWSARLESLRIFWYRRIVSFDQHSQVEALRAIKETTEDSGRRLREALVSAGMKVKAWFKAPWNVTRSLVLAVSGLGLAAGIWAWREFGRKGWQGFLRRLRGQAADPVRMDASRWLAKLMLMEASPIDHAEVVAELQRLRFGARASWPEPERVFRSAQRAVRDARSRRVTAAKGP